MGVTDPEVFSKVSWNSVRLRMDHSYTDKLKQSLAAISFLFLKIQSSRAENFSNASVA